MRVLQVNCVFRKGSTGKIVNDIDVSLRNSGIESVVCYGRGKAIMEDGVYKFCTEIEANFHSLMYRLGILLPYGGNYLSTRRLIKIIKLESPDIVHLHCINGSCVNIYKLLSFLGKGNYKTLVTHHAEFFYTGSCGHAYDCKQFMDDVGCKKCPILIEATKSKTLDRTHEAWYKMKKAFASFEKCNLMFSAVSGWVRDRSLKSPILNGFRCKVVENGLDTSLFKPVSKSDLFMLEKKNKNLKERVVLHVAASFSPKDSELKGGRYILELARMMPDISFVVLAITHGELGILPENLYFMGCTSTQKELVYYYNIADVTVITSKRETFSMIAAESLCCGTPVVGFKAGGPETIAIPEYSEFVEYGDIEALRLAVMNMLNQDVSKDDISRKASAKYSKELMTLRYIELYKELLENIS